MQSFETPESLLSYSLAAFPVTYLGSFCQAEMDNKTAAVRTAAVEV